MSSPDLSNYRPPQRKGNNGVHSFKYLLWYFTNVLFFMNPLCPFIKLKVFLLRRFGAKIGTGVVIKPSVNIKFPWLLRIGNYSWIGEKVWIDNLDLVTIGDNYCISQGALLLCGNHNFKQATFDLITKPITLEDGCWVGAKSVVCPGVTMHKDSILTVGSVASKDLAQNTIHKGNPAIFIRYRDKDIESI